MLVLNIGIIRSYGFQPIRLLLIDLRHVVEQFADWILPGLGNVYDQELGVGAASKPRRKLKGV
jgi:hypothetical protein